MWRRIVVMSAVVTCMVAAICSAQTVPDEKTLWSIWKMNSDNSDDHKNIINACAKFKKSARSDPFTVVTDGIAAWHYLKIGNRTAATELLTPALSTRSTTTLNKIAAYIARTWLTRIDMEIVKQALEIVYHEEIEYPATLDKLKEFTVKQPPMTDQWGDPWIYKLVSLKYLTNINGQKYEIESRTLRHNSDLSTALNIPYAAKISLKPSSLGRDNTTVRFVTTDDTRQDIYIALDSTREGITVAYIGDKLLIISDGNHWAVMPKPKTAW
ncbi:MAG: hypothetical protein JXN60_09065 [Lentisphaerae bacterium]|nr:hypothetical protein [Lentisphaerota bacterium]